MSTEVYSVKGRVVGTVEDTKSENQALAHRDPLCFSRYGISWRWAEQASRRHAWPKSQKVSLINLNILTFHHRNTNVSNYGFVVP